MNLSSRRPWAVAAVALLLCTGLASEALAARKARATGFYRVGRGQVDLPLQFVISAPGNTGMHSIHLGFPNPDLMVDADVTLVGKNPAVLSLPENFASGSYSALLALMGTVNIQITSNFSEFGGPYDPGGAMLAAGSGPGSFSFCPGGTPGLPGAACPTTGGGAPNLMTPPQGTGTRNGRIVYLAGGTAFGGVSRLFFRGGGVTSAPRQGFQFGSPIFQAGHEPFGGMGTGRPQVIGGGGVNPLQASTEINMLSGGPYTQPRTAPTVNGTISGAAAGPFVTSMGALTSCPATTMGGAYPNIPLTGTLACAVGTGPGLQMSPGTTTNTGFPFTTGTVFAQQSTNTGAGADYFTLTGSDGRTSRGIGNITLVAGGLALRSQGGGRTGGSADQISLTISEKTPSISPVGFAAAAVLMLLAAGYALRPRL